MFDYIYIYKASIVYATFVVLIFIKHAIQLGFFSVCMYTSIKMYSMGFHCFRLYRYDHISIVFQC